MFNSHRITKLIALTVTAGVIAISAPQPTAAGDYQGNFMARVGVTVVD